MAIGYYRTDETEIHMKGNICERFFTRNENILDILAKNRGTQQISSIGRLFPEESKRQWDVDLAMTWISFNAFDFATRMGQISTYCGKQRRRLHSDLSEHFPKERRWLECGVFLQTAPRIRLVESTILDTDLRDCVLRNPSEIELFLKDNSGLVPLIKDSFKYIRRIFGHNTTIELEMIRDAESPDGEELVVFVQTSLNPKEALRKLHELDEMWWIEAAGKSNGKVCIHIELK